MRPDCDQMGLFGGEEPPPADVMGSLYLALLPTESARQQMANLAGPALKRIQAHGRAVAPERWHSTLFTLRDKGAVPADLVSSARALASTVRAPAFGIGFDRLRLYLPSGAVALANADKDSAAAGFNSRLFHAFKAAGLRPKDRCAEHITLMYAQLEAMPDLILPKPVDWRVESFALVLSTPTHYETVGEWRLD